MISATAKLGQCDLISQVDGVEYIKPFYSNSRVDKATDELLGALPNSYAYTAALAIINQWRSSHLYPLGKVRNTLKNRSRRIDRNAIIVQRLKRLSSIENKLIRLEGTRLTGMQDIGGCRSIVSSVRQVERIVKLYRDARDTTRQDRSALVNERDYIRNPQETGYRGVHLIIRYQSLGAQTRAWTGRKIEIQLRTKLQHNWATALESMSTFLGQQLKANFGDTKWLRFFALASGVFAVKEGTPPIPGLPTGQLLYDETANCWRELNAGAKLQGCVVAGMTSEDLPGSFFVLKLDTSEKTTTVWGFEQHQVIEANKFYNDLERDFARRSDMDVVLVKVDDIRQLKIAYPNYWADTTEFSNALEFELRAKGIDDL